MNPSPSSMDVEGATTPQESESNDQMTFDPANVTGLEKYQEGDRVFCKVEGTLGPVDESGQQTIKIDRIEAEPMDAGKQASRAMGPRKPDMTGTAMEGQGGY